MEQPDTVSTIAQPQKVRGLSFKGLTQVLYQPSAFFQQLKERPKVLVPYIVFAVLILVFFLWTADLLVQAQMESPQFQSRLQGQPVTPQIERMMRLNIIIGGTIAVLLAPLLASLFGLFWGNFVFAGKARFKQLLSVMLYGELIYGLGAIVHGAMMRAKGSVMATPSLGALATGEGPESLLFVALSKVDVFIIWEIIVIGIGLSIIYNVTRNKGYLLSVLSMGMLSILHVVFTAIMAMIF